MLLLFAVFVALLICGIPVAFAMLAAGILYIAVTPRLDLIIVPQQLTDGLNSFPLLAVPLFVLAGFLMNEAGVTERLVALARAIIGHIRAGLAHALVVAGMLMAGVSGSGTADAAAIGGVMIPAMKRDRYPAAFAAALSACAGAIGPIIPPSIILIIYGHLGNVSVGRLFLAGVVPGVLFGLYLMLVAYIVVRFYGYGSRGERAPLLEMGRAFRRGLLDLMMPVIIIGGIVGGVFTPTEAGAVAVTYVLLIGTLVYRTLTFERIVHALRESVVVLGSVMLVIAAAAIIHYVMALGRVAEHVAAFFVAFSDNPWVFLLLTNLMLLGLGCIIEVTAVLILMTPILVPVLAQFGIDPVHFGVIMAINLAIGLLTPPVGLAMYVTCGIGGVGIGAYARAVAPFLLALIALLVLVIAVPGVTLWLPNLLMGGGGS